MAGGAYYFIVENKHHKIHYRISELTDLGEDILYLELPLEFVSMVTTFGIKVASQLYLTLELQDDEVLIYVEGYENVFKTDYAEWEGYLPEESLTKHYGDIKPWSALTTLYKFGSLETLVLEDNYVYGLEPQLESVHILPITMPSDRHFWFHYPKFLNANFGKLKLKDDTMAIFEAKGMGCVLYALFDMKLASREIETVQVFFERGPHLFHDNVFYPLKLLHQKMQKAPVLSVREDRLKHQAKYIETKELGNDDLVKFVGDTKIRVKDFKRLFVNQLERLDTVRKEDNILLVSGKVDTLVTLYEKVESNERTEDAGDSG